MADIYYYLYYTAYFYNNTISDKAFNNIYFADYYLFRKNISNVKIKDL
jgi:hypothetical protein